MAKEFIKITLLILAPTVACALIYFLKLADLLVLRWPPENFPKLILTLYTTNFVHREYCHLSHNLGLYLSTCILSLVFFKIMNLIAFFRKILFWILLVAPFVCSLSSLLLLLRFPNFSGEILGFSGIASATAGLSVFSLTFLIFRKFSKLSKSEINYVSLITTLPLFGCCFCLLYSPYLGGWSYLLCIFLIILLFLSLLFYFWKHIYVYGSIKGVFVHVFTFIICGLLTAFFLGSLFPPLPEIYQKGVNILAHYIGYVFGVIVTYIVLRKIYEL